MTFKQVVTLTILNTALSSVLAQNTGAQSIRGEVLEETTLTPISGALVTLHDSSGHVVAETVTDSLARFSLQVSSGVYQFTIRRIGFAPITTESFPVAVGGSPIAITITVPSEKVVLEPVTVTGRAQPFAPGPLEDFYRRKNLRRGGVFLTSEEIEERNPTRVTDLFYGMAGVRVIRTPPNNFTVRMIGQGRLQPKAYAINTAGRSGDDAAPGCPPTMYVDGGKIGPVDKNLDVVLVSEIIAVEVYRRASETPPAFLDSDSRCGVIALWTRRAPRQQREP